MREYSGLEMNIIITLCILIGAFMMVNFRRLLTEKVLKTYLSTFPVFH